MARRDEWAKRIEQWAESGLSGAEFAREIGVKEGTLRPRDAPRRLQERRSRQRARHDTRGAAAFASSQERASDGWPRAMDARAIRTAEGRAELRARRRHPIHAEPLGQAHPVSAQSRRAARQQHL